MRRRLAKWLSALAVRLDPVGARLCSPSCPARVSECKAAERPDFSFVWSMACPDCHEMIPSNETHHCGRGFDWTPTVWNGVRAADGRSRPSDTVLVHGSRQAKPENVTWVEGLRW